MSKIKKILVVMLVLLFSQAAHTAQSYKTTYSAVRGGTSQLNFTLDDFQIKTTCINGTIYSVIVGAGDVSIDQKGYADLPFFNANLQLAFNKNVSVRPEGSYEEIELKYPLLPSRGTIYRDQNPDQIAYKIDPASLTDNWFPGKIADSGDPFVFRDVRGINIYVYPFQYNAKQQKLRIYRNLKIIAEENNTPTINPLIIKNLSIDPSMNDTYSSMFINYNKDSRFTNQVGEFGEILVIYTARDAGAIQPYIEWKRQKGFKVTATQVATGTTVTNIIKNAYTANPNILYVQLVGDWEDIKSPTMNYTYNDTPYLDNPMDPMLGCVVGTDKYPELTIGRFSCSNSAELSVQINKAINYEKNPDTNSSTNGWYKRALGIGSEQGAGSGDDGEADYIHIGKIKTKLLSYNYTTVAEAYQIAPLTAATVPINNGLSLINYCGHGRDSCFITTGYSNYSINASTNGTMLPVIFSVACMNGSFQNTTDCFAEKWIKKSGGGAVATLMASIITAWKPPMRGQDYFNDLLIGGYTYSGGQSGTNTTAADQRTTFGSITLNGNVLMLAESVNDVNTIQTIQTWTIFGDASLQIRNNTPKTLSVNSHSFVPREPYSLTVTTNGTPVKNAIVSLYQNGITCSALTNSSGVATISHSFITGTVKLTVTGYNTTTIQEDIIVGGGYPFVAITNPVNNAVIPTGSIVDVAANATDTNKSIVKVDFYIDGILKETDTSAPYNYSWNTTGEANGTRVIRIIASTGDNKTGENSISVIISDGAPIMEIVMPTNNSTISIGSMVSISANVNDLAKSVSKVEFYINDVLKNTDTSTPYEYNWDSYGSIIGNQTIKVVATDDQNNSAQQIINVNMVYGQVSLLVESFESSVFAPSGWTNTVVQTTTIAPVWSKVNSGIYPTCAPGHLSAMASFNSYYSQAGAKSRLATKVINGSNFNNISANFKMYHDTDYYTHLDKMQIQYSLDGTTWVNAGSPIERYITTANTWTTHNISLPACNSQPAFYVAFLGISYHGENMFIDSVTVEGVAKNVSISENLPQTTMLNQNYPNPFNPETTINFELNNQSKISLSVYNAKGELVEELINLVIGIGKHSVKFDGSKLNSGVYFYKLVTPEKTMTKKMILMK